MIIKVLKGYKLIIVSTENTANIYECLKDTKIGLVSFKESFETPECIWRCSCCNRVMLNPNIYVKEKCYCDHCFRELNIKILEQ